MRLPSTGIGFALLLGALAALPPLAIDMALPALSPIVAAMGTTASLAGLTLGVFLAGFAIGPIARICVLKQRPRVCPVLLSAPDTLEDHGR